MITVSRGSDGRSLRFFDAVGNASTRLRFRRRPTCAAADPDGFPVDVETAREVAIRTLTIDRVPSITLRDERGNALKTTHAPRTTVSRQGRTFVELCTPVKLYVDVDGFVEVATDRTRTTLDFGERRPVRVGARVKHDRPSLTVTTTSSVQDVFAAVSTFGRLGLPEGPERSFQSYRPHPPVVEFGDAMDVPEALSTGGSRLHLSLPGTYFHAAVGAPLAYYLGATVSPGHPPGLHLDDEQLLTWEDETNLERACARLLQRVFFLDCLARTGGGYDVTVQARDELSDELEIAWNELAALPLGERVRRYLSLPNGPVDAARPPWTARAYVVPNRTTIETLPYLAYDLLPVSRARSTGETELPVPGAARRPTAGSQGPSSPPLDRLVVDDTLTLGADRPIGTDGVLHAALRNRSRRNDRNDAVSVTVVCNDARMLPEQETVESIYGAFAAPSVEVRRHLDLDVDELAAVLRRPTDYLHYIGHILPGGFKCSDGTLTTESLETVGAEVFFLNACRSRAQGAAMIERGAVGGIATRRPVGNHGATAAGQTLAELLIRGYPLGIALGLAQDRHAVCRDYAVVGDPRVEIADTESGLPYLCHVRPAEDGYVVDLRTVLTTSVRKGSLGAFHLKDDQTYYLNPTACRYHVDRAALARFLDAERVPVRWQGAWAWSDEVRAAVLDDG